jgi:tetratricopeptide (TPR) repeat protein
MLLLTGDSLTALRIVEDASRLNPNAQVTAALLKNKAWAELNLGFYPQAIEDATRSNSAAAECILGKVYAKLGKSADAVAAWKSFREKSASPKDGDPVIEPDCKLLAEVANENH